MRLDRLSVLAIALAAGLVAPAKAQTPSRGRIAGRINDSQGAALEGARVTLTATGITRSVVADPAGSFSFDELVASADLFYALKVDLAGFEPSIKEGIVIANGETVTVDFPLKLGCNRWVDHVVYGPRDELLIADLVAHVRIAADGEETRVDTDTACHIATQTTATVVDVAKATRPEWRSGQTIRLYSEDVPVLKVGAEYLAFLTYSEKLGQFVVDGMYFRDVVRGRVQWFDDDELGFRDGSSIDRAVSRLRTLARRGPRRLDSLRFKTGWLLFGTLSSDSDTWTEARPFDFATGPEPPRELPRAGDRIRLKIEGWISILDFVTRGEARRLTPPIRSTLGYEKSDDTDTRVNVGEIYGVADARIAELEGYRLVWVRLVAVKSLTIRISPASNVVRGSPRLALNRSKRVAA